MPQKNQLGRNHNNHLFVKDAFSSYAEPLRKYFDSQFANPQSLDNKRFVWDYWHVPDQYSLLRTPAYHYFPEKTYLKWHHELVQWGRRNLGCWDISPPWLSCYIDGCKQDLHSDVPHGPWAYVYSLSPKKIKYTGGETLILKPETLNYWKSFSSQSHRELSSFIDRVNSPFNRLTVFDPRFPHGVTEVKGTRDPREGRLVIHGWFMEPKTYIEGNLNEESAESILDSAFDNILEQANMFPGVTGTVSIQMSVQSSGKIQDIKFGSNTLIGLDGERPSELNRNILKIYKSLIFPKAKGKTTITQPLIF